MTPPRISLILIDPLCVPWLEIVVSSQDQHTQGSTLECLEDNEANLTAKCRHRVLRVAELQSDDYHMNRAVYYACRDDREHFCSSVESGQGRVYACLMKKKFHPEMSNEVGMDRMVW